MSEKQKNVPKLRFPEFTSDWERRKLSDVLKKYDNPIETPHNGYERLGIRSHAKGTFHSYVEPGKELETAKMHRVSSDKFIVNITFAWEHAVAVTDKNDEGKIVSHRFPQFSLNDCLKPAFFKYVILDNRFREHLVLSSPGGAGRNRVLKIDDMLRYTIAIPTVSEQINIAHFLTNFDTLITLQQRKLDQIKEYKKGMLQKMFPNEGETVPEVRFPGFSGEWERKKLGDVTNEFRSGSFIAASNIFETGMYPVYGGNGLRGYADSFNHDGEFALIGRQGALCGNMNYSIGKAYFTEHAVAVEANEQSSTLFLYYLLGTMNLGQYSDQSAQPGLAVGKLVKLQNLFPTKEEQVKIAQFLNKLDTLITLQQRKLEAMKEYKKGLLQQMFV